MLRSNLLKYNSTPEEFNVKVINDIIFDEKKKIVSTFKDFLLLDEVSDFLKRFYNRKESLVRIPKICDYYLDFLPTMPNYAVFSQQKIIIKNMRRKRKILELLNNPNEIEVKQEYSTFLACDLISSVSDSTINLQLSLEDEVTASELTNELEFPINPFEKKDKLTNISITRTNYGNRSIANSIMNDLFEPEEEGGIYTSITVINHQPEEAPPVDHVGNVDPDDQMYEFIEDDNCSVSRVMNLSQLESHHSKNMINDTTEPTEDRKESSGLIKRVTVNKRAIVKKKKRENLNKEILGGFTYSNMINPAALRVLSPINRNGNKNNAGSNSIKKQNLGKETPVMKWMNKNSKGNIINTNTNFNNNANSKTSNINPFANYIRSPKSSSSNIKGEILKRMKKYSTSNQNLNQILNKNLDGLAITLPTEPNQNNMTNTTLQSSNKTKENPVYNISLNFNFNVNLTPSICKAQNNNYILKKRNIGALDPMTPKANNQRESKIICPLPGSSTARGITSNIRKIPSLNSCKNPIVTTINLKDKDRFFSPIPTDNKSSIFRKNSVNRNEQPKTTKNNPSRNSNANINSNFSAKVHKPPELKYTDKKVTPLNNLLTCRTTNTYKNIAMTTKGKKQITFNFTTQMNKPEKPNTFLNYLVTPRNANNPVNLNFTTAKKTPATTLAYASAKNTVNSTSNVNAINNNIRSKN